MRRPRRWQFAAVQRRAAAEELRQARAADAERRAVESEKDDALACDETAPLFSSVRHDGKGVRNDL